MLYFCCITSGKKKVSCTTEDVRKHCKDSLKSFLFLVPLQQFFPFFYSFLSLFSFPARQNRVWTPNLRPIVWDPKSWRERTDLPARPSAHTQKREKNGRKRERQKQEQRTENKRGERRESYCSGPPGWRQREWVGWMGHSRDFVAFKKDKMSPGG